MIFVALVQWRMQDGDKGGLNNENLGLELEINGDLRLINRGLMKKSGSLEGVVALAAPPLWIRPCPCIIFSSDHSLLMSGKALQKEFLSTHLCRPR